MQIRGKNVIVTGGVHGLGRQMVEQLRAAGASVAVLDCDADGLRELQRQDATITCIECDVSDYHQVVAAAAVYHRHRESADVLINNAGIIHSEPLFRIAASGIEKHDVGRWRDVLAADLSSVFHVTLAFVEHMIVTRTKGVVANISSVSAGGQAGQSAYSAAKAGVNALTAAWAKELGPLGIRVVGVAPGFADTPSTRRSLSESALNEVVRRVPLRRLGRAEEVAAGVLSVIENDFFHGKVFALDGGLIV